MGRGITILALVLVILLVWTSGCADVSFGSQQLGDFGNSPEERAAVKEFIKIYGDPTTNSGPPRFLEPMVSTGLVNNTPVDKVTKFSKDTGSIWFWVFYDNFKKGDPLTLTWTYNGKTMISLQQQAGGDFGRAFGEFLRPDKGWATGTHTITISGGGTSASSTFEIVDGRTETVPLPYAENLKNLRAITDKGLLPVTEQPTDRLMDSGGQCFDVNAVPCNGVCVNTAEDPDNCGACGVTCPSPQVCIYGECGDSCEPTTGAWLKPTGVELRNCDRHCADIMSDEMNCGGCGMICLAGSTCEAGKCPISQVQCAALGWVPCGGGCVYTANDPDNCGACGRTCPSNQVCNFYDCRDSCAADPLTFTDCDRHCVDTLSDPQNCGACGTKCVTGATCSGGKCLTSSIVVTSPKAGDTYYWDGTILVEWNPKFSSTKEYPGVTIVVRSELDGKIVDAWNMVGNDGNYTLKTKEFTSDQKGTQQFHVEVSTNDDAYQGKSGTFTVTELLISSLGDTKATVSSFLPAKSSLPRVMVKSTRPIGKYIDVPVGKIVITNPRGNLGPTTLGGVIRITWDMGYSPANTVVYIDLMKEDGGWGGKIASQIPNTEQYDWNTGEFSIQPGRYFITMCTVDNICGKSDVFEFRAKSAAPQPVPLGFSQSMTWTYHRSYNSCVPPGLMTWGTGTGYEGKMLVGFQNHYEGCPVGSMAEQFFYRGVMVLDTSTLSSDITKATLTLHSAGGKNSVGATASNDYRVLADVWVLRGPFDANNWKAAPEIADLYTKVPPWGDGGNKVTIGSDGSITIDITELVQKWKKNPQTNYGIMFQGPSEVIADNNDDLYGAYDVEAAAVPIGFGGI